MRRFSLAAMGGRPATVFLLNENCEGVGTPSPWATANGSPNWDYTAVPLADTESLYLSTNGAAHRVRADFTNQTEIYAYFLYKLTNGTVPSAAQNVISFAANGGSTPLNQWQLTTGLKLRNGTSGTATAGVLALDTIYHVWVHYQAGTGGNAFMEIGFSTTGVRPTSGNNYVSLTTGETNSAGRIWLGTTITTAGLDQVFDNIRVASTPIGDFGT